MPEPFTLLGITAAASYVSKDTVEKLLGPSADYIGNELVNLIDKCNINLGEIFYRAIRKVDDDILQHGQVSPRVLSHLITEAAFIEDPVVQEYFAGMIASSRVGNSNDDRAIPYCKMISSLSSFQIQFHYLIYASLRKNLKGRNISLGSKVDRKKLGIFISIDELREIFSIYDDEDIFSMLEHCIYGLRQKELIEQSYIHGDKNYLLEKYPTSNISADGFIIWPSLFGIDLWLWANGKGGTWTHKFLNDDLKIIEPSKELNSTFNIVIVS